MTQPPQRKLHMNIDAETARGHYANFVSMWHDNDGFVLDFAAMVNPPAPAKDEATGQDVLLAQAQIVTRVRVPPSQVFEIMKALEQQLTAWEKETGKRPPGAPETEQ